MENIILLKILNKIIIYTTANHRCGNASLSKRSVNKKAGARDKTQKGRICIET